MKHIICVIIFLLTIPLAAQEKKLVYQEESLVMVIQDLEAQYNVRFSFNSAIIKDKTLTYSGTITLKEILQIIATEASLEFLFLDEQNIIVKKVEEDIIVTDVMNLDEVLISTEYITSGFDKNEKDGSVKVKPNKLGILPGLTEPDVLQSLQLLPGISSPTESASDLYIRGGTPDQNLVLWDGIKMYHQGHFFGMISAFNPYITEEINVYRSGTSAKYGDRISGVIDIRGAEKVPEKTAVGVGLNLIQGDVFIKTPIAKDKLGIVFSARRSYSDIVNTIAFEKMSQKVFQNTKVEGVTSGNTGETEPDSFEELENRFYFTDYNIKAIWSPNDKNTISLSTLFVKNKLDFASRNNDIELNSKDNLNLSNNGYNFSWNSQLSSSLSLEASSYISRYESIYDYQDSFGPGDLYRYSTENTIDDSGIAFNFNYRINPKNKIILGYDLSVANVDYNIFYDYNQTDETRETNDRKVNTHSFFGEHEFHNDNWMIRTGIRTSILSGINKTYFEPRLYLSYKLNNAWKLKASGEIKNQVISKLVSLDFNDLGLGNSIWALSDDEERPVLNNRQLTGGVLFEKRGWKLDIDGYYKKVKGLTSFTRGFNSNVTQNYATGSSNTYGIDILLKKRIKSFRTWIGYSLSKSEFTFDDINDSSFPGNYDQRHVLTFSNTYLYRKFQFSLGWSYATGKPFTPPLGFEDDNFTIDFGEQNSARLNDYHKLDASILYDFFLNKKKSVKARCGISVLNIYNRENEIDKIFKVDSNSDETDPQPQIIEQTKISLGATPNVVFRLTF